MARSIALPTKTVMIRFLVNPTEARRLRRAAAQRGQTLSAFLRDLGLRNADLILELTLTSREGDALPREMEFK